MSAPALTAAQAQTFSHKSAKNAAFLQAAAAVRGCTCRPYQDWFTYRRWKAQGYQVQKGEKSTRIPVIVSKTETDPKTGQEKHVSFKRTSCVFCRCQVQETA